LDVSSTDEICGLPVKRVRDACKKLGDFEFSVEGLRKALKLKSSEHPKITDDLLKNNLIARVQDSHASSDHYELTEQGRRLANAVLLKRINREKADELIKQLIARATEVNARAELTHWVQSLRVFGSYVSDRPDLGDIDVAVTLCPRTPDGKPNIQASLDRAEASGKTFGNYLQQLFYGQHEVQQILKARSPFISIHSGEEIEELGVKFREIFHADQPGTSETV